ncbi:major facilitator superfamily domain-containing protein [Lipomyces japonicus]|uniref:major facilitator superfamily domain-containing protein n=1 Tax=Lipomyces japonicus TaxID=56871 RepID=UPI0034CED3A9
MSDIRSVEEILEEEINLLVDQGVGYEINLNPHSKTTRPGRKAWKRSEIFISPYDPEREVPTPPPPASHATFSSRSAPWYKTPSIYLLLPAFFLLTVSFGGLIAPKLDLLLSLFCRVYYADQQVSGQDLLTILADTERNCQTAEIHARVSKFQLTVNLIHGVLSAVISPKLGVLSDRIGRTPILALSAMGPLISNVILILASKSTSIFVYRWFLVGAVFEGLCGGVTVMMTAAHSYATDCTSPEQRASVFGLFHACLFIGMALGPAFGGYLVSVTGTVVSVFYVAAISQVVFMFYVFFIIPESLSRQQRLNSQEIDQSSCEFEVVRPRSFRNLAKAFNFFLHPLRVLWPTDGTRLAIKKNIIILASIDTLLIGAGMSAMMVILLYVEFSFGWRSTEAGYLMSITGAFRAFVLVVVLPVVVKYLKRRDSYSDIQVGASSTDIFLIRFACFVEFIVYIGMALSSNGVQFAMFGVFGAIGGIASPTLQSTLTKHVPRESIGAVLGALALLHSLCSIVAPTIFSTVYAYTIGWYPRAVFLVYIAVFGGAFLLSLFITRNLDSSLYENDEFADIIHGDIELSSEAGNESE